MSSLSGHLLGRFVLGEKLGRGGMAEVYRATDSRLDREVAIKVILPLFAEEPQFVDRFLREAKVVASLDHPNILPVYDFGEHQGSPYLVMPWMRGGTLAQRLAGRPIPLDLALAWVFQLASALDTAHAAGVVHRDVKPGNVLIGAGDRLVLADFGLARLRESATRLTRTGTVVGTPIYMAPEVAAGRPADAAADRYALAVLAFELLAGRPPYEGDNVLSIMHQHASSPVPSLRARVASLPPEIDGAMQAALAKDPVTRPPSCRALADSLAAPLPADVRAALGSGSVPPMRPPAEAAPTLSLPRSDDDATLRERGSPAPTRPESPEALGIAAPSPPPPIPADGSGSQAATLAAVSPSSPSYADPAGAGKRFGQWIVAAAVGGLVAIGGFLLLRTLDRPEVPAGGAGVAAPGAPGSGPLPPAEPPSGAPPFPELPPGEPTTAGAPFPDPPTVGPSSVGPSSVGPSSVGPSSVGPPRGLPSPGPPSSGPPSPAPQPSGPPTSGPRSLPPEPPDLPLDQRPGPERTGPGGHELAGRDVFNLLEFEEVRSGRQRPTAADFRKVVDKSGQMGGPAATALESYARGGLAYLRGDVDEAGAVLRRLLDDRPFLDLWGPGALTLLSRPSRGTGELPDWELALGYGDPDHRARALIDARLEEAEHWSLYFGKLLVLRLDAQWDAIVEAAWDIRQDLGKVETRELRSFAARVVAEAFVELGESAEALAWYQLSLEQGGRYLGQTALKAALYARRTGHRQATVELFELACSEGNLLACQAVERSSRRPPFRRGGSRRPPG